jgi:hypothetical protein
LFHPLFDFNFLPAVFCPPAVVTNLSQSSRDGNFHPLGQTVLAVFQSYSLPYFLQEDGFCKKAFIFEGF